MEKRGVRAALFFIAFLAASSFHLPLVSEARLTQAPAQDRKVIVIGGLGSCTEGAEPERCSGNGSFGERVDLVRSLVAGTPAGDVLAVSYCSVPPATEVIPIEGMYL